ncbi:hypothetical protein B0J12DRAFT_790354 [Macrophomina phaseolina]|uniref:Uncharacterized protein n=1 Tax=Macrophomina phaseolina TaxID=35725 RepID=A0ABQ8FT30_9PEZI|nr:hypothetical protein B0J12DRAFT_790354 [Macrophomina phaseolina]
MSAAVKKVPQEADLTGSSRPTSTKLKPTGRTTKSGIARSDQNSNIDKDPKDHETKEKEPAQHRGESKVSKAKLYTSVDDAQSVFHKKARDQGLELVKPEEGRVDDNVTDSESDDEETKAADEEQRKKMREEGEKNQRYRHQAVRPPPDEFLRLYTELYPTVRNWWTKDQTKQHHERMEKMNGKLREKNKSAGRAEGDYLFPYRMISEYITGARVILERIRGMQKGPQRTEEAKKMFSGHVMFSEQLGRQSIDLKMLTPKYIREELDEISSMPELEEQRRELRDILHRPTIKQRAILEPAVELLNGYYDFLEKGDVKGMDVTVAELDDINKRLRGSNLNEGLKEDDHILPVDHLRAINGMLDEENIDHSQEEKEEAIRTSSKRVKANLQCSGVSDASIPGKYTEGDALPEEELKQMQQNVSDFEGPALRESAEGNADAEGVVRQGEEERMHDVDQHQGRQTAGDASPKLMSLPKTRPLINPGIEEGITDYGKVLSVTKAGFGHRVFTNIGTDIVPVYKMFPGSSFAKSVRSALYEKFSSKPQPPGMKDNHIEILDIIVHPVKNGKYTWIVYKWTAEPDPKPRIMTHTDLALRLGREPALKQEKNGLEARKKRLEILSSMKEHPETAVVEGVPPFNDCPPYMADGFDDA